MIKYLVKESIKTYREEGVAAVLNKAEKLFQRNIDYLRFKKNKIIYGNTIYQANSVKIDMDFSQFNKQTKSNFMSGEHFSFAPKIGELIEEHSDDCDFVEIGGGSGYTSCYFSQYVEENNSHITIEANPSMIEVLLDTKSRNDSDFEVISAAYSSTQNLTELKIKQSYAKSGTIEEVNSSNKVVCACVSLDEALSRYNIDDFILFCNAEGIEYELIDSEFELLKKRCSLLIISFHTFVQTDTNQYTKYIKNNGFEMLSCVGNFLIFKNVLDAHDQS